NVTTALYTLSLHDALPILGCCTLLWSQAGFEDHRVMLQGFYWESYRHGHTQQFPGYGDRHWYAIVQSVAPAIRDGHFNLIWMPPDRKSTRLNSSHQIISYA